MLPTHPLEKTVSEERKTQRCIEHAMREGFKASCAMFVLSAAGTYTANKHSKLFRSSLGVSGKAAMIVIPTFGTAMLASELALLAAQRNPERYGILVHVEEHEEAPLPNKNFVSTLGIHHRAANWSYENPFRILGICCVPIVGSMFYGQTGEMKTHLKFSQKVMHTRIFSQATVLTTLLGLMFFRDYMDTNGMFVEGDDHAITRQSVRQSDEEFDMAAYARSLIKEAERKSGPKSIQISK
jgi:hypothetical protein